VPDAERQICHVQRRGSVRRSHGISGAAVAPEVLLESVDKGAARNPRGAKGLNQVCLLGTEEGRLGVRNLQGCRHRGLLARDSVLALTRDSLLAARVLPGQSRGFCSHWSRVRMWGIGGFSSV